MDVITSSETSTFRYLDAELDVGADVPDADMTEIEFHEAHISNKVRLYSKCYTVIQNGKYMVLLREQITELFS